MIPTAGQIVHYKLGPGDEVTINRRRADAIESRVAFEQTGMQVHVGNEAKTGDVYPLIITRVWDPVPTEQSVVNGQVMLDGNDTLWVSSVSQGDGVGQWHEAART